MAINTSSMEQLREILFPNVPTVRVDDTFDHPDLATDMFECDLNKLNALRQRGADSFAAKEIEIRELLKE